MEKVLQYKLTNITSLEYKIVDKETGFFIPDDVCEVNSSLTLNFMDQTEEVIFLYTVKYVDKRSMEDLMHFQAKIVFRVIDFNNAFSKHNNIVNVPDVLLHSLIPIVIGAVRGMLALKNKGTYLQEIYLPIFNTADIVEGIKLQVTQKTQPSI